MPELDKNDIDDAELEQLLFGDDDSDDNDEDSKDTDDDRDVDEQDSAEDDPEWKPPTQAEWRRANAKSKKWRYRATGKDPEWKYPGAAPGGAPAGSASPEGDGKADEAELRKQIRAEIEGEFASKAEQSKVREAAVTSLVAAGVSLPDDPKKRTKAVAKLVKLLDLDEVTVDGDDIEGLDEQVEQMAKDYPALFTAASSSEGGKKPPRRRVGGAPNGADPGETKDPLRAMAKAYFGNQ